MKKRADKSEKKTKTNCYTLNAIAGEKNSLFCAAGKPSVDHIGLQLKEILVPARREGKGG